MYRLIKVSSDGFDMFSESLDVILAVLEGYICSECFLEQTNPEYHAQPTSEQIEELLSTQCGAEFIFWDDERHPGEPPLRKWHCKETPESYVVFLEALDREVSESIPKQHWENHLWKPDLLRCAINRLQRKMFNAIFPTYCGKFKCDWEL